MNAKKTPMFNGDQAMVLRVEIMIIDQLSSTGIFEKRPRDDEIPIYNACITFLLIHLKDALAAADVLGQRIDFSDEIAPEIGDVTDLVAKCRNVACHITSADSANTDLPMHLTMMVLRGKTTAVSGRATVENPHADDIAIYFGDMRIFLGRHCFRAVEELKAIIEI